MVAILDIQPDDIVIEIGPGEGMVTQLLLESAAKLVISVEIDYQLVPKLIARFNEKQNFELVHQDVMRVNWNKIDEGFSFEPNKLAWQELTKARTAGQPIKNLKFIGSLPYNISKFIIQNAILEWPLASQMVFLIQEEVAINYVAQTPKSTFLSNWIRLFADVKKHKTVPASQFFPQPKVGGGILQISPKQLSESELAKVKADAKLVRVGFSTPRKTLQNNFRALGIQLPAEIGKLRAAEANWAEVLAQVSNG
jgi:16S rRNA (adenine1518-N6/adenine1519-N6)-dimethyltransferase